MGVNPVPFEIKKEGWYTEDQLRMHGFDGDVLKREYTAGRLESHRIGPTVWIKGEWLQAWMEKRRRAEGVAS